MPKAAKGILTLAGAVLLLFPAAVLKRMVLTLGEQAEQGTDPTSLIVVLGLILIVAPAFFWLRFRGFALLRKGRRHFVQTVEEAIRSDPRPPILLLRSFEDDEEHWVRRSLLSTKSLLFSANQSLEEALVECLTARGPVVAVGVPGESLPPLGAARLYVKGDGWQEVVTELIRRSQVIVVILGETPGLQWELQQACRPEILPKVVLVVPPTLDRPTDKWDGFLDAAESAGMDWLPDEIGSRDILVTFPRPQTLEIYRARKAPTPWIIGFKSLMVAVWPSSKLYLEPLKAILAKLPSMELGRAAEPDGKAPQPSPLVRQPVEIFGDSPTDSHPPPVGLAPVWRRVVAGIMDYCVVLLPAVAIAPMLGPSPANQQIAAAGFTLLLIGYLTTFDGASARRTLGKKLLGLRVVKDQEKHIGYGRSFRRALLKTLFGYSCLGMSLIVAAFTKRNQSLHDFASSTYVVMIPPLERV